MAKSMKEAELVSRPGDEDLAPEQLLCLSIFDGMKAANLARFPGALVMRRYRAGEIVCRQGAPGWTAFYILPAKDVLALRETQAREGGQAPDDLARLRTTAQLIAAGESAEDALANRDPAAAALAAEEKRRRAQTIRATDSGMADLLEQAADVEQRRACATVSLAVSSPAQAAGSRGGWLSRLAGGLMGARIRKAKAAQRYIPIDGPVDLRHENPVATLHEGELFGEMSCMNRYPRSATVRVTRDCYMIEMLRNILELLQKNKAFKEQMDAVYRRRVLAAHLRSLPIFSDVSDDCLASLATRVELLQMEPGEVLFKEGDPSDSVYVIRLGMVKVTQEGPGGERVLAYRGRGEYIGEIGALKGTPRMATCTALDHPVGEGAKKRRSGHIELIRISLADVEDILTRFPAVKAQMESVAARRIKEDATLTSPAALSPTYDQLGLMQGQKLMLIDLDRCTRCDECVTACAATHADGRTRLLREGPRFDKYLIPSSCRQCIDPVCMIGCPVGSIHKGKTGEMIIEDWCIGCEICAKQCPYDSINMHAAPATNGEGEAPDVASLAVVCDQCGSLSDHMPSCVYACPHDAAMRIDGRTFFSG